MASEISNFINDYFDGWGDQVVSGNPDKYILRSDFLSFVYKNCKTRKYNRCDPVLMSQAVRVAIKQVQLDFGSKGECVLLCNSKDAEWVKNKLGRFRYDVIESNNCEYGTLIILITGSGKQDRPFVTNGRNLCYSKQSLKGIQTIMFK